MLNSFIGYTLGKTALTVKFAINQMFIANKFGITPEQWSLLYYLDLEDGQYQNNLAKKVLKQSPNITRLIDILERKKLLTKEINKEDRRAYKVYITEEGKKLTEAIYKHLVIFENTIAQGLDEDEIVTLKKLLGKLTDSLKK
jgi:MarR family transcriptional regulator for hemolysin